MKHKQSTLSLPHVHLGMIAVIVAIVYSPAFHAHFYLDDFIQIIENPMIQNSLDLGAMVQYSLSRFIGYLTFAFDHALYGNTATGYHITNSIIHLLSGWALYGLLTALICSPVLKAKKHGLVWLPLIAAIIFVLHPLQTAAVTYIIQRFASLAGMLYISSMALYAWGRITSRYRFYGLSLVCTILAFMTKENTLTLPAAILLLEFMFFRQLSTKQALHLFVATVLASAILIITVNIGPLDQLTRESQVISRPDYLATQVLVLWRYVGLFFFPFGQRLEYDIILQTNWFDPTILAALVLHACLILGAWRLWHKSPLLSFGILFYYLTHLVESSFIPITDLMFEHRTYLPNVGLSVLVSAGLVSLLRYPRLKPVFLICTPVIFMGLSVLTIERNQLWADQIEFLKAETRLSPNKERVWTSLGKELMRRNRLTEASTAFTNALELAKTKDGLEVLPSTLMNAILLHHYTGQFDKAFKLQRLLPLGSLSAIERSKLHEVSGISYLNLQKVTLAKKEFSESIRHSPNLNSMAGLALVEMLRGEKMLAETHAREVLSQDPNNMLAARVIDELGLN